MAALASLDRAEVVAICSRNPDHAREAAGGRGLKVYTDVDVMLRQEHPDAVYVCVPPHAAPAICLKLAQSSVPFLVEKPVAALDRTVACQVACEVERRDLVAAVGYHLRALDFLEGVRAAVRDDPPGLLVASWVDKTPQSDWWAVPELSGGQVIEQMTHFYDLARSLVGDGEVVAAANTASSTSALIRFRSGAIGSFVNSHHAAVDSTIALALVPVGTIRLDTTHKVWTLEHSGQATTPRRNPYAVQAAAFIDAVAVGDPARVLATYRDGLATHLLTQQVVTASGGS